jgi:hypothetical protein
MGLRYNPVVIPDAATYTVKDYNSGRAFCMCSRT